MKNVKLVVSLLLVGTILLLTKQIVSLSIANQADQHDYAELNDIKYGLFSVNQWKNKLATIVNEEIAKFQISGNEKKQLKPMLEKQLSVLIDNVYEKLEQHNEKTFKGRIKQVFIESVVDIKVIKQGIPKYADDMIKIIEKPKNRQEVKGILLEKVEGYFQRTFEEEDLSRLNAIVAMLGVPDIESAKIEISSRIQKHTHAIFVKTWIVIVLAVSVFVLAWFSRRNLPAAEYFLLVTTLLALLVAGVTTPMINLEAKITEMSFVLFDQPVKFLNQILYFQSKSVVDVFGVMIAHPDIQMKVVGILMVAFSIAFPLLKLLSSLLYFYDVKGLRQNGIVRFFVLKSGKWSMTDVLIIAIFMAYIGFNGIISSQFGKMQSTESQIVLLTTNGTSLQFGFYLFLAYAVLSLFLAEFLGKPLKKPTESVELW